MLERRRSVGARALASPVTGHHGFVWPGFFGSHISALPLTAGSVRAASSPTSCSGSSKASARYRSARPAPSGSRIVDRSHQSDPSATAPKRASAYTRRSSTRRSGGSRRSRETRVTAPPLIPPRGALLASPWKLVMEANSSSRVTLPAAVGGHAGHIFPLQTVGSGRLRRRCSAQRSSTPSCRWLRRQRVPGRARLARRAARASRAGRRRGSGRGRCRRRPITRGGDRARRPDGDGVNVDAAAPAATGIHACGPTDRHARALRRHLWIRGFEATPCARRRDRAATHPLAARRRLQR